MIVVTGATGNVGSPLVRALAEAGEKVTAVSRTATRATRLPSGVRHELADLADPASLAHVLDGADALFLLVPAGLLAGGADPRALLEVVARGVPRVVLLSSQGARTRPEAVSHEGMRDVEEAVGRSGVAATVLRPGGFDSNALAWAEAVRAQRAVVAPFADVGLPLVDPADIAEVAAAALLDGAHAGRTYELTGPEPVSPRQQAAAISGALAEPVRFVECSRDEARAAMVGFMPESVADTTLSILGEPTTAEQRVSPDVQRVLGRSPRSFTDWVARNVAAFR